MGARTGVKWCEMDPKFDKNFDSSPLNQSPLYHDLLSKIMGTQLAGSSKPMRSHAESQARSSDSDCCLVDNLGPRFTDLVSWSEYCVWQCFEALAHSLRPHPVTE